MKHTKTLDDLTEEQRNKLFLDAAIESNKLQEEKIKEDIWYWIQGYLSGGISMTTYTENGKRTSEYRKIEEEFKTRLLNYISKSNREAVEGFAKYLSGKERGRLSEWKEKYLNQLNEKGNN